MNNSAGGIYAIYDKRAQAIVGGLVIFRAVAAAIRYYGDVASMPDTQLAKHLEDFDLIELGVLTENSTIVAAPTNSTVISGETYKAQLDAQKEREAKAQLTLIAKE